MTTRGIKNNNPLNVIKSTNMWEGKITPSTDSRFEQFKTAEDGIRAGAKLLLNYQKMNGLNTIYKIISRFAPNHENPTDNYAEDVAKDCKVEPDDNYELDNYNNMSCMIKSMIRFENNNQMPYSEDTIRNALKRVGIIDTPNKSIIKDPIVQAGTAATVVTVAQAVAPYTDVLSTVIGAAPWVIGVLVVGIVGYVIYRIVQGKV